ncbi:hypothetical protein ASG19_09515 [Rhizobium sp. Leaf306]|nr:hypothetical protein ASG19_09515 [Rhizobium sp. Leaf306]
MDLAVFSDEEFWDVEDCDATRCRDMENRSRKERADRTSDIATRFQASWSIFSVVAVSALRSFSDVPEQS